LIRINITYSKHPFIIVKEVTRSSSLNWVTFEPTFTSIPKTSEPGV